MSNPTTKSRLENGEIIVIDNFPQIVSLEVPREYRTASEVESFPGKISVLSAAEFNKLETTLQELLDPSLSLDLQMSRLRFTEKSADPGKSFIHSDPFPITGILYLELELNDGQSPDLLKEYGTWFYRSKKLGWDKARSKHIRDRILSEALCKKYGMDLAEWDVIQKVSFRSNRLVVYDGANFHSPSPHFLSDEQVPRRRVTVEFFGKFRD